ncbi:ribosome-binding protein aMBF1 (putative translation factor) [Bradyrhizobium sp. USDA 4354]
MTIMVQRENATHSPYTESHHDCLLPKMEDETGIIDGVAAAVRKARKSLGLSQEDWALEAGVDRTYVGQVERGTRNCTIVVLARLARALKATSDRLLVPQKKTRG